MRVAILELEFLESEFHKQESSDRHDDEDSDYNRSNPTKILTGVTNIKLNRRD
jgi:hypothetical protein